MKKKNQQKITRTNYKILIRNYNLDLDFCDGLTRFYFENKDGFVWSYRFFKLINGYYQTKARLGHGKENYSFCGSLETIFE